MSEVLNSSADPAFPHVEMLSAAFDFLAQDALNGRSEPRARPLAACRRVGRHWAAGSFPPTAANRVARRESERSTARALAHCPAAIAASAAQYLVDAMSAGVAAVLSAYGGDGPVELTAHTSLGRALLEDDFVTQEDNAAPAYLVVAFAPTERAQSALRDLRAAPGVLTDGRPLDNCGHVLIPAVDESTALESEPLQRLAALTWIGVRWGRTGELSQAREVADAVLELAITRTTPGIRSLTDVVVEYAVLRTPLARETLRPLGTELAERPPLAHTISALVEAGGNRSGAARVLGVHRSTVDQRITAIEQLTALSLADPRGLALVSTAVLIANHPQQGCFKTTGLDEAEYPATSDGMSA